MPNVQQAVPLVVEAVMVQAEVVMDVIVPNLDPTS